MIIVRMPVRGPIVAMKAVGTAPRAPKQRIVAIACLQKVKVSRSMIDGRTIDLTYGNVRVNAL